MTIFLSNFLALLMKVDAAGESNRSILGGILIAVNVLLVVAVLASTWFATQQSVDDQREGENAFAVAKAMLTHEQVVAQSKRLEREESAQSDTGRREARVGGDSGSIEGGRVGGGSGGIGRVGGGSGGVAASLWSKAGVPRPGGGSHGNSSGRRLFSGRTGSVSAARVEELWEEDKAMERSVSSDSVGSRRV